MAKTEKLKCKIEKLENNGYGCMFADHGSEKLFPYELFSEEMLEQVTALYFVKMTDNIFENGLDS